MINATKEKLATYFQGNSQFIVPFFQRGYVWDEDNWETFWEHISAVLDDAEKNAPAEHFIGTLITKRRAEDRLGQSAYDLIDGQQRLTTIAVFLKAIGESVSGQMPSLKSMITEHLWFRDARGNSYPRIVPSGYDKRYYDAIIAGEPIQGTSAEEHKIVRAYRFFMTKLKGFGDERLDLLRLVLLERVPAICMLLSQDDDEQEIFDTINALGVRLTTGELLKNYVFKEKSIQLQYDTLWKSVYEANDDQVEFWAAEKTAGRIIRTNIEVLLYCYLIIKTGGDVKLESLFKEYKKWLGGKSPEDIQSFLKELKEYADIYFSFPSGDDLNQIAYTEEEKRFFHVVENLMVTTIYPLVLYIYKRIPAENDRLAVLRLLETYLVRRNVCRLTTKNYNSLFIQIIAKLEERRAVGQLTAAKALTEVINEFQDPSNLMPTDQTFEGAFKREALSNQNSREILFLIALYHVSSGLADVARLCLRNYSVEHMMPMKWEEKWLIKEMTEQEKAERNRRILTLGNLTLVTKRLNSKLQNSEWGVKTDVLKLHSSLRMTVNYLDKSWEDAEIDLRAGHLAEDAKNMWPWIRQESH